MRLILLFSISQMADVASTIFSLGRGNIEVNPLTKYLIQTGGVELWLLAKLTLVLALILLYLHKRNPVGTAMAAMMGLTFAIASWNLVIAL